MPGQLPVELEYEVDEFIGVGKKRKLDDFGGVSKRRRTDSSVSLPIGEWTRYRLDSYGINYFSVNSDSHFCFQPETEPGLSAVFFANKKFAKNSDKFLAQSTPLSPELEELTDPNLTASFIKSFVSLESAKKTNLSRRQFSFASHLHQIYRYSAAGNSSSASTTIHGILDGLISNLLAGAGLLDHRFCLR